VQFDHGLVNYDLPWNPMQIEPRIGRPSRVGQTRDVHVFDLVAPGTIEESILHGSKASRPSPSPRSRGSAAPRTRTLRACTPCSGPRGDRVI
jgi:hypothetical protein